MTSLWIALTAAILLGLAIFFMRRKKAPDVNARVDLERPFRLATDGAQRRPPDWVGNVNRNPPKDERGEDDFGYKFRRVTPISFIIEYSDFSGRNSTRRITIHQSGTDGTSWCLRCWCHERDAWRSFRCDRIEQLIDATTGEVHKDIIGTLAAVGVLSRATADEIKANEEALRWHGVAPEWRAARESLEPIVADIDVLILVAKADGRRSPKETKVIFSYIRESGIEFSDDKLMRSVLGDFRPEPTELSDLLREVEQAGRLSRLVSASIALIEADGKITPAEQEIAKALESVVARTAHVV